MAARAGMGTAKGKAATGRRRSAAAMSAGSPPATRGADARPVTPTGPAEPMAKPSGLAEEAPFSLGRLGQVALTATDMNEAVAFYGDVLGLKLIARFDPPGLAFFRLGGGVRLLLSATASAASLYFTVDDLESAVLRLGERGVTFLQKPAMIHRDDSGDFGRKGVEEWMAFFNDPSGNLLALVERR